MHHRSYRPRVRGKVWLEARGRFAVGDGGVRLLQSIDDTGSIRAAAANGDAYSRAERTVLIVTAGLALWNMGVAYVAGLLLYYANRRGLIRLD
jgi:hypothetical protein